MGDKCNELNGCYYRQNLAVDFCLTTVLNLPWIHRHTHARPHTHRIDSQTYGMYWHRLCHVRVYCDRFRLADEKEENYKKLRWHIRTYWLLRKNAKALMNWTACSDMPCNEVISFRSARFFSCFFWIHWCVRVCAFIDALLS